MIDFAEHLGDLSDTELLCAFEKANEDLAIATVDEPESEWHQSCFAAVFIYASEIHQRGLSLNTRH